MAFKSKPMTNFSYTIRSFKIQDLEAIKDLMRGVNWPEHYVGVHAHAAEKFLSDDEGDVLLATQADQVIGLLSMKHQKLNFLTCIYTFVVGIAFQRKGLGRALLAYAEAQAKKKGMRGLFLDTTENNTIARLFYKAVGLHEAYSMPHYYLDDLNGVTYLKLFNRSL